MTADQSHELARACEQATGYHDPESVEPERPPTIESRYGFAVSVDGHPQYVQDFERFAERVVDLYATTERDIAVGIVTDDHGSIRDLAEPERLKLLGYSAHLVLS